MPRDGDERKARTDTRNHNLRTSDGQSSHRDGSYANDRREEAVSVRRGTNRKKAEREHDRGHDKPHNKGTSVRYSAQSQPQQANLNNKIDEIDCIDTSEENENVYVTRAQTLANAVVDLLPQTAESTPPSKKTIIQHLMSFITLNTPEKPCSSPHHAHVSPQRIDKALLQQLTQAQVDLKNLQDQLQEATHTMRHKDSEIEKLKKEESRLTRGWRTAAKELERMDLDHRFIQEDLADSINRYNESEHERMKLSDGVEELLTEKGRLDVELECLRSFLGSSKSPPVDDIPHTKASLEDFDHTLDQMSESNIKGGVDGINDMIDILVSNVLEGAATILSTGGPSERTSGLHHPPSGQGHPLILALFRPSLDEESRGLLLDAFIHTMVVEDLNTMFFRFSVVPIYHESFLPLEEIFKTVSESESWNTSQRWRSITSSHLYKRSTHLRSQFGEHVRARASEIARVIMRAYGADASTLEILHKTINDELMAIYNEAYALSVSIKRDILTVRVSVSLYADKTYDPRRVKSVWAEMGIKVGDTVIGHYHLGLVKQSASGESAYLIKPEVVTQSLLRHVGQLLC